MGGFLLLNNQNNKNTRDMKNNQAIELAISKNKCNGSSCFLFEGGFWD